MMQTVIDGAVVVTLDGDRRELGAGHAQLDDVGKFGDGPSPVELQGRSVAQERGQVDASVSNR